MKEVIIIILVIIIIIVVTIVIEFFILKKKRLKNIINKLTKLKLKEGFLKNIPKIVYINLDKDKNRRIRLEKQLKLGKAKYERIEGILVKDHLFKYPNTNLKPGELGVHYLI